MALINKKAVKQYALDIALQRFPSNDRSVTRGGKKIRVNEPRYIRVSPQFLMHMELALREKIRSYIQTIGGYGRTLK